MDFYDEEIKQYVSKLPSVDTINFLESIFNSMVNTMGTYYREIGHSDSEANMLIQREVDGVKNLLRQRVAQFPDPVEVTESHGPETVAFVKEALLGQVDIPKPMDDQFDNDTTIDLALILSEFGVRE